jgi:NitT/TauT family transport system substrate-binding protein
MTKKWNWGWIGLVLVCVLAVGSVSPASAADKISFRTDWLFWAGHLPYVVGNHQGVFKKHGIDLQLVQGSGSAASVKLTATGTHQMALASGTNAIMGVAQGLPIKVIGIVYQWDPWGYMAMPKSGIRGIRDFKGKKIADSKTSVTYPENLAVLQKHGFDPTKDVVHVNVRPGGATQAVISGTADLGMIMIFRDNYTVERLTGKKPLVFAMKDLGVNIYGMTLIANQAFLAKNKDAARRMVAAINESWEWTFQNKKKAVDLFHKVAPLKDRSKKPADTLKELNGIIPFVQGDVYASKGLLWSDPKRWTNNISLLYEQKVIPKKPDLAALFTNDLVPEKK